MGEIWARDWRDIGERWAGLVRLAHAAKRRRAPHLLWVVREGLGRVGVRVRVRVRVRVMVRVSVGIGLGLGLGIR